MDGQIEELSTRVIEVVRLMATVLANAEIGAQIHRSEGTIRSYISTILDKFCVLPD